MNNYDDLSPTVIRSGLRGTKERHPSPHIHSFSSDGFIYLLSIWLCLVSCLVPATVILIVSSDTY